MYTVTVQQNISLTEDTHVLVLSKPEGFTYAPGQFVVLQTTIDGKPVRRSYSLLSAPHQKHLELLVKAQPHGLVSPHLCALTPQEQFGLLGPFGQFTKREGSAVFVGAGTGIAPFISYLRDAKHRKSTQEYTLLCSFRYVKDILFAQEISALKQALNLTYLVTITRPETTWDGLCGRINKQLLSTLPLRDYYLCGPTPMVVAVKNALNELGAPNVYTEKYGSITA